ncbi:MAG: hypothetical protein PHI24_14905 [Desulfitobacteriaceae bacterium]|nr:hypothetical protein [Desulfitobacteriaceae bacterium]
MKRHEIGGHPKTLQKPTRYWQSEWRGAGGRIVCRYFIMSGGRKKYYLILSSG